MDLLKVRVVPTGRENEMKSQSIDSLMIVIIQNFNVYKIIISALVNKSKYGHFHKKTQTKHFFQLWTCVLTTCYQINLGYIPNPLDKELFTIMQNYFLQHLPFLRKKHVTYRTWYCEKVSHRSHALWECYYNNKCWSHIAPCSRLYLVKLKVAAQLKSQP